MGVTQRKTNRIAFRATPQEIVLMEQLKKDWQLNDFSKVLHKILATFHGIAVLRAEELVKIKANIDKWQVQSFEVYGK